MEDQRGVEVLPHSSKRSSSGFTPSPRNRHRNPSPPAPPLREQFEKKADRPIDLTQEFNHYVEKRLKREERDRDFDGPGRDLDESKH